MSYETNAVLDALLNTDIDVTKEVEMPRFGVAFTLRALTMKEINKYRKQATAITGGKGKSVEVLDEEQFAALLIAAACVNPDWTAPALKEKFGVETSDEVVSKRLLAGEIATLSNAIMDVSGFDLDALTGKAKN
jgi:hypothetical protein